MDTFILAATSFTIAVSLMITGKKDKLQASFAGLCAAVFVSQAAITLGNLFHYAFLAKIRYLGVLAIAPAALLFFRYLTRGQIVNFLRVFSVFVLIKSVRSGFCFYRHLSKRLILIPLYSYTLSAFVLCYMH